MLIFIILQIKVVSPREFTNVVNLRCNILFLKHRISDQTSNSECDWSNLQRLYLVGCDTQGVKNNILHLKLTALENLPRSCEAKNNID